MKPGPTPTQPQAAASARSEPGPLPWHIDYARGIMDADNFAVAYPVGGKTEEQRIAALIVLSVNTRPALLARVATLEAALHNIIVIARPAYHEHNALEIVQQTARTALAQPETQP